MPTEPRLIDARGLKCPLPVLKLEKMLDDLGTGSQLTVLATDPMAEIDIPLYCRQHGHQYTLAREDDVLRFEIVSA
ncbi:sulfurtransferase TusA family protein [Devosia soli]|uniref:sulfurtransferase TusA family protein n=1 Tax=Devosia soli TaxID=361041 RepID=UPI001FCD222E|nr:sulfurtransferase TusA family protein [Devosia soli]